MAYGLSTTQPGEDSYWSSDLGVHLLMVYINWLDSNI